MPNAVLNNVTAPDTYMDAATLYPIPYLNHFNLDVFNQPIYWQIFTTNLDSPSIQGGQWENEVFLAPASRSIYRLGVVGVRIRAAVPLASIPAGQNQAQVTLEAIW